MRRFSPQAESAKSALLAWLRADLAGSRSVLELASGTGQQVAHFAAATPDVQWWPTEREAIWLESIASWTAGMANVRAPTRLELGRDPWPDHRFDLVLALNLLHLVDAAVTAEVFRGAAAALSTGGALIASVALADHGAAASEPAVPGWGVTIQPPRRDELETAAAGAGFEVAACEPLAELSSAHRLFRFIPRGPW